MVYYSRLEGTELPDDNDSSSSSGKPTNAGSIVLSLLSRLIVKGHQLAVSVAWSTFSKVLIDSNPPPTVKASELIDQLQQRAAQAVLLNAILSFENPLDMGKLEAVHVIPPHLFMQSQLSLVQALAVC